MEVDVREVDEVECRGRVEVDVRVVDEVEGRGRDDSVDAPFETCTNGSARSEVVKPCCGITAYSTVAHKVDIPTAINIIPLPVLYDLNGSEQSHVQVVVLSAK